MSAKYVFPLTVDADYQQGLISLNRLVFSMESFSPEKIANRLNEGKIFDAMLPNPSNILSYPEALLVFSPFSVSLPFNRVGSQLHFFNNNLWMFPYYLTEGIFENFSSALEPIPVSYAEDYLGLFMLGSHGARCYFMATIEAVNSLLKYLNNPLNFLEKDGIINHKRLLQSHSAIHLMFADLMALNFTNSKYSKTRYTLSFLDKMANLRAAFYGNTGLKEEAAIFNRFLSDDFGGRLSNMLDHHLKRTYDKLGRCISGATSKLYAKISEHPDSKEFLRTIRNSSHGSFLKKKRL